MDEYKLIFVNIVGKDRDENYIYDFLFTDDIDLVWGEDWEYKPAGICGEIPPTKSSYSLVKRVITEIKLDVAQKNTCFSMQDCMYNIVALAWENIDDYDEYPDNRLVLQYGEDYEDVIEQLKNKNINIEEV